MGYPRGRPGAWWTGVTLLRGEWLRWVGILRLGGGTLLLLLLLLLLLVLLGLLGELIRLWRGE